MQDRVDVVVIGSGAAGGALTWRLTEMGAKVVCLEQGGWIDPSSFPSAKGDYETHLMRGDFNFDPNVRQRPEDYPTISSGSYPPSIIMFNAVGGTTIHWQGHFTRFHPSDFLARTLDGVADDWPVTYEELEPYYDLNDEMIGVSGLNGDPANPPRSPRQTPPLPIGKAGNTIVSGFEKLGWHWWPSDQAILSAPYKNRPPCMLHGKCMFGCPIGAKASTDRTYWPLSIEKGAEIRPWSRVKEITVTKNGQAKGVLYFDKAGNINELKAKVVVVCCNGVGTPRLLLNSKSSLFPNGLANSNGVVGKYFMIHPAIFAHGVFHDELDSHLGAYGTALMSQEFYETRPGNNYVRGFSIHVNRTFGPFSQSIGLPWGTQHHDSFKNTFPHRAAITSYIDDLPEEHNRVELSEEMTDDNDIAAAKITYALGENSEKLLAQAKAKTVEALEASGAKQVIFLPIPNGGHLMGSARMGLDPQKSVVNANNQAHDVKNLFIVDGSSFATAASINPTSTIMALALRAADKIWDQRRNWS
jgi:choline dehydrogenase-like flavoprotein